MVFLPTAPFAPDNPDYNDGLTSARAHNVVPRSKKQTAEGLIQVTYGPMPTISAYSSALPEKVRGACPVMTTSGSVSLFAGTGSGLYRLSSGSTSYAEVTPVGGITLGQEEEWTFANYGNRVIAAPGLGNDIQSFDVTTDTNFAALSASAPRAKYLAVIRNRLVCAHIWNPTVGYQRQSVQWSAVDNPAYFPEVGSLEAAQVGSDLRAFPGDHGWCQGIVSGLGAADGALFFERAIYRIQWQGGSYVFSIQPAEGMKGTPAPKSIVNAGAVAYYLGEDGFYAFDGQRSSPIGAGKIDEYFLARVDTTYIHRVVGVSDPETKTIFWAYPTSGSTYLNRMLAYRWDVGEWSTASVNLEHLCRAIAFGYTADNADSLGYNADNCPFSPDSRFWSSGRIMLAAFDSNHRLALFNGAHAEATVDTAEIRPSERFKSLVTMARPYTDGGTPSVAIGHRNLPNGVVQFDQAVEMNQYGECPQLSTGRFIRGRITLPAGSSFGHIQGVSLDVQKDGEI